MSLRVLHIGKFFPPYMGGMETYLADLIDTQRRQGIDAYALVHGQALPQDPPWLDRVATYGSVLYAPVAPGFRRALRQAIKRWQPDVLHLHLPNTSAFWALTLAEAQEIPWVIHWHSDVVVSSIRTRLAFAYRFYRPFEQALLAQAHCIVATSPDYVDASHALQNWRDKCFAIPLGIRPLPGPAHSDQTPCPPWTGATGQTLRLLSIGRLAYYKGFETLIQAVAPLANVELLIAGEGELRASLEALIAQTTRPGQTPNIRLLGRISDQTKATLLASCDVFCLASRERTEAFGVVLLEAMQHAKPCLVSALTGSGMPWLIRESGAGQTVAQDDIADWQRQILDLAHAPAHRVALGLRGQQALEQRFSLAASTRQITALYQAVAPERRFDTPVRGELIVIPARNESASIGNVISRLRQAGHHDIVVINDQSTDNTAELAVQAGATVLNPPISLGAWGAMQTGIRYALSHGYAGVITMDADGQHEVDEIASLLALREQADVVIGACPERGSRARRIAWAWFRRLTGFSLADLTSGFRYYNRTACQVVAGKDASLLDYQDVGILILLRRSGMQIAEVPVAMHIRQHGASKIYSSWAVVARYMAETTLLCLAHWHPRNLISRV